MLFSSFSTILALKKMNTMGLIIMGMTFGLTVSSAEYSQEPAKIQKSSSDSQFQVLSKGEILDPEGLHLSFTSYRAPDGTGLLHLYNEFDSPDEAHRYLEKQARKAVTIINRSEKKDEKGKAIGYRVEALISTSDTRTQSASVYWTNGAGFHQIIGDSFQDIIQLESKFLY